VAMLPDNGSYPATLSHGLGPAGAALPRTPEGKGQPYVTTAVSAQLGGAAAVLDSGSARSTDPITLSYFALGRSYRSPCRSGPAHRRELATVEYATLPVSDPVWQTGPAFRFLTAVSRA
jgi:hypothetical protein